MIVEFFALFGVVSWTLWHRRLGAKKAIRNHEVKQLTEEEAAQIEEDLEPRQGR
jgi:hypothetical protein